MHLATHHNLHDIDLPSSEGKEECCRNTRKSFTVVPKSTTNAIKFSFEVIQIWARQKNFVVYKVSK